tara:strand:+ start:289 stop:711 length:423 start_codon:yes stop_codon:yes gene_type:complete
MTHYRKTMKQILEEVDAKVAQQAEELAEKLLELDENDKALKNKAEKSGMPLGVLKKVFKRGVAAWKGGHRPGTNPQQWGLARVNSFVTKSSGTWGKADADLAKQVRGEEVEQDEAVSAAQQAAIAISKKERGEKPKKGKE